MSRPNRPKSMLAWSADTPHKIDGLVTKVMVYQRPNECTGVIARGDQTLRVQHFKGPERLAQSLAWAEEVVESYTRVAMKASSAG